MAGPLLAEMCEAHTPLGFSLRTPPRRTHRFRNHAPARAAAFVPTGSGFYTVHVQGPWLPAQSFCGLSSRDGAENEY